MKNFHGLFSFTEAAAAGSFTAAASKLNLTPAAVSKNIARLESQLGVRLFNRSTRRLRLTAEGEAFRARTAAALRALDEAVAEASHARAAAVGRVRISVGVSFGRHYLPPLLPSLLAAYPELQIEVSLDNRAVDMLSEGFDIVIRGGVIEESSLVARRIARLPLVLVASPEYLREKGVPVAVAELQRHELLSVRTSGGAEIPWRFRQPHRRGTVEIPLSARLWLSDPEALLGLAAENAGIAQVGLHHAMPYLRTNRLKVVLRELHDAGDREIMLHYPHRLYLAPRVRVTVDGLLAGLAKNQDLHAKPEALPRHFMA
ncbi:MAG: LysR family transcriptional regulator [Roseomonas sp.]|jgi:DNA-binding transcriptional LysR family regulator|nr:LysR family transcriptional regulator [Roseomonas sp.]